MKKSSLCLCRKVVDPRLRPLLFLRASLLPSAAAFPFLLPARPRPSSSVVPPASPPPSLPPRRRPRVAPRAAAAARAMSSAAPRDDDDVDVDDDVLGGDWAGLSATFDPASGALVPVPEHLVPASMVEWGDVPSR